MRRQKFCPGVNYIVVVPLAGLHSTEGVKRELEFTVLPMPQHRAVLIFECFFVLAGQDGIELKERMLFVFQVARRVVFYYGSTFEASLPVGAEVNQIHSCL